MNTKVSRLLVSSLLASLVVTLSGGAPLAAEPPAAAATAPSKETREQMATMHEQMAACLRSDKPIADCRKEAMKHHQELMGKDGCPMTGTDSHMMQRQSGKPQ
jgi:hypothetical protein